MEYMEIPDKGKMRKIFKKKELDMEAPKIKPQVKHSKTEKTKNTLSVYTYLNFKRFGVMASIDDGIKINILVFETHIKFEKR